MFEEGAAGRQTGAYQSHALFQMRKYYYWCLVICSFVSFVLYSHVLTEFGYAQDASIEVLSFANDGRRKQLQIITKDPIENIIRRLIFRCQGKLRLRSVGIGNMRITKLWKMPKPAAALRTANWLAHFIGWSLYIQFVQYPEKGICKKQG